MAPTSDWHSSGQWGKDGFCRTIFAPAPFIRKGYGAFEDFCPSNIQTTTTYWGWDVTPSGVGEGTLVMADEIGGVLNLVPAAVDNQGIQMQWDGESILPAANKDIWFEARVRCTTDQTETDWFIGLATTDTSIVATPPNAQIGFWSHDADDNIDFVVADAAQAPVDTGTDMVLNTWINLGFHVTGVTSVTPYINGVGQTPVTANIPAVEMAVSIATLTGEGASNIFAIDWYRILQIR